MNNNKTRLILIIAFLAVIFGFGSVSLAGMIPDIAADTADAESQDEFSGEELAEQFRSGFAGSKQLINIYGLFEAAINKSILGDNELIKTDSGLMINYTPAEDTTAFSDELAELKGLTDEKGIPLVYIQMPARTEEDSVFEDNLYQKRRNYEQILEAADAAGILTITEDDILGQEDSLSRDEFFLKNDVHPSTQGEIWMANYLEKYLQPYCASAFGKIISNDDQTGYIKYEYPFKGNLIQSVGKYYNGLDTFTEYIPENSPHYVLSDIVDRWVEEGDFQEMLMNDYADAGEAAEDRYWITDYLRYGSPGYKIKNCSSDGPRLLFICDSMCYRTLAYLSIGCSEIDVIDPRFSTEDSTDFVRAAMGSNEYDAVIYLHGSFEITECSMFGRGSFN